MPWIWARGNHAVVTSPFMAINIRSVRVSLLLIDNNLSEAECQYVLNDLLAADYTVASYPVTPSPSHVLKCLNEATMKTSCERRVLI